MYITFTITNLERIKNMSTKLESKKIVKDFNDKIYDASVNTIEDIVNKYYHEDLCWNGPQPINTLNGRNELINKFWKPFLKAFPDLQKNSFMHLAGNNHFAKDQQWVVTSGHYVGTFENDWLDIPASKGIAWITYIEFNRLVDNKIVETYTIIDILDLMRQVGLRFIPSLAPEVIIPGPATNDGVIMGECEEKETKKTFQIIYDMIYKGLAAYKDVGIGKMGLEHYFSKDFIWYGPCGIGTTRGIKGFEKYHQKPFLNAVPDRRNVEGEYRIYFAEGEYGALIEWTGFRATHTGNDWLGLPATGKPLIMRDADLYRREGDKIVENWCYMDVIDVLLQLGVDIFDRVRNKKYILL